MMETVYLSRVRLRRDASVAALAPLLLGRVGRSGESEYPAHHLVWSLFADHPGRQRDFLWREMARGVFLILSARRPEDRHDLFEVDEPKVFAPELDVGDRLGFSLRANPVVRRRDPSRARSVKHDVVMDALRACPSGGRAGKRHDFVKEQGLAWLQRQGVPAGFTVDSVATDGYEQHRVARKGTAPMLYSTLDFEGVLTVENPARLPKAIARGFGAAKAYGCGLLLVRRV